MTQQLIKLIERVKTWPVERQKDAARLLEAMEGSGTSVYLLSDHERRAVDVGLDDAKARRVCVGFRSEKVS